MTPLRFATALLLVAGQAGGTASAEPEAPAPERRLIFSKGAIAFGGYFADFKTDAVTSLGSRLGTRIRLEDDLEMDSRKSVFRMDGHYRFSPRHALAYGYWSLARAGQTVLESRIEFPDQGLTFEVGASLISHFDVDSYKVNYRYTLLRTDRGEAGFLAGLSTYRFELSAAGEARVDGGMGGVMTSFEEAKADVLAPVPVVGFFMAYSIAPRLSFSLHTELFDLDTSSWEGRLLDAQVALQWLFSKHVGIGFGINGTEIEYRGGGSSPLSVDYRQSGLLGALIFTY